MDNSPPDISEYKVQKHDFPRIGVTGHRKIENVQLLRKSVQRALSLIDNIMRERLKNTQYTYHVISPLAEGADRLVVKEVMEWKGLNDVDDPSLEVVIPLPKEDYIRDFESSKSKAEFEELLSIARSINTLEKTVTREVAYENVGRYVVDNCDFFIAIWDGKPAVGQGGTGVIVEYARKLGRHMFWINSDNGNVKEEISRR